MVAIRDLKCSMDIAEMAALGWFPHEFIVYGCCYVEKGACYYKVSSQDIELYQFKEAAMRQNIYVTPIIERLDRVSVPSGMCDEYALRTKIKLAKQLQCAYEIDLMKQFLIFAEQDGNDSAIEIVYALKHKLLGCFERDILNLAESIVTYAFQQKKLKRATYEELQEWFSYIYSQMEDDIVLQKNFKRTFYGFAHQTERGTIRYVVNASEYEIRKKKEELYCKGILSTPVLQKVYYFDTQPNLANVKTEFLQQMKQWMDEEYWWYLTTIDALPPFISVETWNEWKQSIPEQQIAMQECVQYYQTIWNL